MLPYLSKLLMQRYKTEERLDQKWDEAIAQSMEPTLASTSPFSRLPIDLKRDIFDFVQSKTHQGNARLVSREWNHLMSPQMWRTFTTTWRDTTLEEFKTLPADCLRSVRELNVNSLEIFHNLPRLQHILDQLGDGQLLAFKSNKWIRVPPDNLSCLLSRQPNLRSLSVLLDLPDRSHQDSASWLTEHARSTLHTLTSLDIKFSDRNEISEQFHITRDAEKFCIRDLITSAAQVRNLEIRGASCISHRGVTCLSPFGEYPNPIHVPPTLGRLVLSDILIGAQPKELLSIITFATLHSLALLKCEGVAAFMSSLAASFRRTGSQLNSLTVRIRVDDVMKGEEEDVDTALYTLLSAFTGLQDLHFDWSLHDLTSWSDALRLHQQSLKSLTLKRVAGSVSPRWHAEVMADTLRQCSNLEQFACEAESPTRRSRSDDRGDQLSQDLRLRYLLDAIAAAPSIHVLRLLYDIDVSDSTHTTKSEKAEQARLRAPILATQIQKYLVKRGSNVRLLAFSPTCPMWQKHSDVYHQNWHHIAANYHPNYYYRLEMAEVDGLRVVDAVPFPTCLAERPDATILRPLCCEMV